MKNQNSDRTQRSDQMIQKRFHRRWKRVVSLLSGIVVFCTTYALILPAITLESPVYCGKEEHIHSDICYQESSQSDSEGNPLKILTCTLEEHEHSRQCESNPASVETAEDWKNFLRDEYLKEMEERFEESDSSPEIASSELPQNTEKQAETSSDPSEGNEPEEPDEISERINQLSLNEKVLLVARSQLNAEARKDNFQVMEDGTERRWNRYASISSDPYDDAGTWFVPWILKLLERDVVWQPDQAALMGQLEELAVSQKDAQAGDIVVFRNDSEVQFGVLSEVKPDQSKVIAWTDEKIEETETELNDSVLILKPENTENLREIIVDDSSEEEPESDAEPDEAVQNQPENMSEDPDENSGEITDKIQVQTGNAKADEADAQPLADSDITVKFDNNLPKGSEQLLTVENEQIYEEFLTLPDITAKKDQAIVVPSPTDLVYRVKVSGSHPRAYLFQGWVIGDRTYQPGDKIPYSELKELISNNQNTLTFKGTWTGENFNSVNFYVLFNSEQSELDYSGNPEIGNAQWINNVYTTYVKNYDDALYAPKDGGWLNASTFIAYQSKASVQYNGVDYDTDPDTRTPEATDSKIRLLASPDGITKKFIRTGDTRQTYGPDEFGQKDYKLGLISFPSDELVFRVLRKYQTQQTTDDTKIKGNHGIIEINKLNAENYTIQWRVFKISHYDKKWHIDGKLVPKKGYLQVTKQFYGDAKVITALKEDFSISVNDPKGNVAKRLVLSGGTNETLSETTDQVAVNPVEISEDGNTYTWRFPVQAFSDYTIYEQGYEYSTEPNSFVSVAQYSVSNSKSSSQNSRGRQYYTKEGVTVTAEAYSNNDDPSTYQTVNFFNSYFNTSTFMLQKVDELGESIPDVTFTLKKGEQPQPVYQDTKTGWWYPEQPSGSDCIKHDNGKITTDDQGNALIVNFKDQKYEGTYTLSEETPYGYSDIDDITLTISKSGEVELEKHPNAMFDEEHAVLLVTNKANTITVTANKEWDSAIADKDRKDVYVQLLRNGIETKESTVLNDTNKWSYTWSGLPGKVGGKEAVYTVRETQIGDSHYDPRIPYDGFADYEVSYSNPERDANGNITLTVTNALYEGGFTVRKTDETGIGLEGAVFGVYSDSNYQTLVQQSTSGSNGDLSFTDLAAGTYYLKEISAPVGYEKSDNVYLVKITGSGELFELKLINSDGTEETVAALVNRQMTLTLNAHKKGTTVDKLPGAVFKLEKFNISKNEYETINAHLVSLDDGSVSVPPLTVGKYRITEVQAPDGYMLLSGSYDFEVNLDKDKNELQIKGQELPKAGYKLDENSKTLTITNDSGERLPETGGSGTQIYTFSGLAAIGVCLMYAISKRYSERRES